MVVSPHSPERKRSLHLAERYRRTELRAWEASLRCRSCCLYIPSVLARWQVSMYLRDSLSRVPRTFDSAFGSSDRRRCETGGKKLRFGIQQTVTGISRSIRIWAEFSANEWGLCPPATWLFAIRRAAFCFLEESLPLVVWRKSAAQSNWPGL